MRLRLIQDYHLLSIVLALAAFGTLMVYSAGVTEVASPATGLWRMQLAWIALGMVGAWVAGSASDRVVEFASTHVYFLAVALLVLTLVGFGSGAGTAQNTTSWLTIAGRRLGQPSELAKIAVVLLLARILAGRKSPPESLLDLWRPLLAVGIPWLLILKQGDLGTALVLIGVLFAMLYWAGVRWQLLLFLASPAVSLILAFSNVLWGVWFVLLMFLLLRQRLRPFDNIVILVGNVLSGIAAPILWDYASEYQRNRITTFLDPTSDPRGAGYHVLQSQKAIGSGGWFGQGFTEGTQKSLSFLPEQHTDFIFAVVGEELGFFGVVVALSLFLLLFLRCVRIAERANGSFTGLVAFGLAAIWFVHVVVNIGMTLNLMPITGIPLPFFSYGGSFMLACWLCVGLLQRVSADGRGAPQSSYS